MTPQRLRRSLLILAAAVAVLSLAAFGAVIALAAGNAVAPVWLTSAALYGLPAAFLLMALLVLDAVVAHRRARGLGRG